MPENIQKLGKEVMTLSEGFYQHLISWMRESNCPAKHSQHSTIKKLPHPTVSPLRNVGMTDLFVF